MKLVTLLDKVRDDLRGSGHDVAAGGDIHPMTADLVVLTTVRALGLEVNAKTGEVYNPAHEGDGLFPRQQNVHYAGMKSRGARRKR